MSLATLLDRNKAFAATDAGANNPQTASGLPAFRADAAAIETFAVGLAGSGKPLVISGATLHLTGFRPGRGLSATGAPDGRCVLSPIKLGVST